MSKDKSKAKKDKTLSISSKVTSKPLLRKTQLTITIPETKEIRSSHFTKSYEEEKKRLYFK